MRESLDVFRDALRINYLCILATEILGVTTLADLPALLTGFSGISMTLDERAARAVRTLRLTGFAPTTRRELRLAINLYQAYYRDAPLRAAARVARSAGAGRSARRSVPEEIPQFFEIDRTLVVRKAWTTVTPGLIAEALAELTVEPLIKTFNPPQRQDPTLASHIKRKESDYAASVEPLGFIPPESPAYSLEREGKAPGMLAWSELIEMANCFDEIDEHAGRQAPGERSWYHRLHDRDGNPTALLLQASSSGLVAADGIDLSGIKHLIGLPGAGKTTLLYLIAACMARRESRACFLFPSIEVATNFIETLDRYDIACGLLAGQGDSSRMRHVANFATSIARDNNGFSVTRPSARFFATNCALAAFTSEEDVAFPHLRPPCSELKQTVTRSAPAQTKRCALAGVCARQQAERELIAANIWAGHALSLDRSVSTLFSDFKCQHFEFVAKTFDLVVVDECDGAQASLDVRGTPIMRIFGDKESICYALIRDLHGPVAGGRNAFVSHEGMPSQMEMSGRFGIASQRLASCIQHLDKDLRDLYQNKLLTTIPLLADMYPYGGPRGDEDEQRAHAYAREGLERLWEEVSKALAYRQRADRIAIDEEEGIESVELEPRREMVEIADRLGITPDEAEVLRRDLVDLLRDWDADPTEGSIAAIGRKLRSIAAITSPQDDKDFFEYCGLLVNVAQVVLQHFGMAPNLRMLNSMGLVSDDVFESRPSRDQLAMLPESLAGRISGIRFTVSDEGNVNITHVSVRGTPRRLFDRMHGEGGAAFLLTSATSLLEQSPGFHVNVGPHYVLKRPNAGRGWDLSRYTFLPLKAPNETDFLRFSGARLSQRAQVLTTMVDRLLGGQSSLVQRALDENDVVDGCGRKAAFVVNSYEQCRSIYEYIRANHPAWASRVRYLRRAGPASSTQDSVTAADVESLGSDTNWDLLVFPMSAIGRGVNIVYRTGPRMDKAMIGSLYFLTRPHPRQDDLGLIQGMIGRRSERFDLRHFDNPAEAVAALAAEQRFAVAETKAMLRIPLAVSRLGEYAKPFVADQMIIILQTIGRAMRGDCPAFVYFVDAAWAPHSAFGNTDTNRTSMLVMMQDILGECLDHPDPTLRECYENLYQSFAVPLSNIENLHRA